MIRVCSHSYPDNGNTSRKPPGSGNICSCTEVFYFESEHDRLELSALEGGGGSFGDKCEIGCH